jgi:hypothetical protein
MPLARVGMKCLVSMTFRMTKRMTKKHTTGGIPRWSPTLVLVARFSAYVWQSGRDAQFSLTYGRMCLQRFSLILYTSIVDYIF